ncbi:hypothetical protein D3C78_1106040 [compost metagenome]
MGCTILPVMPITPMLKAKRLVGAPIITPHLRRTVIIGSPVINRNPHTVKALHAELVGLLKPIVLGFSDAGVEWLAKED